MKSSNTENVYTKLQDVCSGDMNNEIYIIANNHRQIDPIESVKCLILKVIFSENKTSFIEVLKGRDLASDYSPSLECLARGPRGELYVGEEEGFFIIQNGRSEKLDLSKVADADGLVRAIYVADQASVEFGMYSNEIVSYSEGRFVKSVLKNPSDADDSVQRIHGLGAKFAVAVGNEGLVAVMRDGKWSSVACPSNTKLQAVWCKSEREVYIGGWDGSAWRWDGEGRWEPLEIDFDGDITKFRFSDFGEFQGKLYAANSKNGVSWLDGNVFRLIPKVSSEFVTRIRVTNCGLIGLGALLGAPGTWLTRFDGKKWTSEQVQIPM
ncbi:hypothetical protein [Acidovorax sp. LjRoot117]|uniref:hypothetical protein n=1 Tax=Acidovorax sp. LjRoot117 TaxID=3342255 RepID=UPI003ECCA7AB